MTAKPFGLYVHIPFCNRICHYCDFAKTANYSEDHVAAYIRALSAQLHAWRQALPSGQKFSSVFFGGGTPTRLAPELLASI
ncbi:MAG: coproporphyrinogen III oxidase, partial [Pseudomonadota bacterium]